MIYILLSHLYKVTVQVLKKIALLILIKKSVGALDNLEGFVPEAKISPLQF